MIEAGATAAAGIEAGSFPGGLTRRIIGNITALTAAQIFYRLVSLVLSIILMRYLGVREQGVYGLVLNFTAIFGAFADLGISNLVIRDMNQDRFDPSRLISTYLTLLVAANVVLFAAAFATAAALGYEKRVTAAIVLAAAGTVGQGVSSAFYAALVGRERMKRVALLEVAATLVVAAGVTAVVLAGGGVVELAGVSALAGFARLVLFARPVLRLFPGIGLVPDLRRALSLLRRGVPFMLLVGSYALLTRVDVVLIEWLSDEFTLGIYTAAARLTYPLTILSMMTATAVFPVLSRCMVDRSGAAFTLVRSTMLWLAAAGLAVAAPVALLAHEIIPLLAGSAYAPAGNVLRILIWYIPILYLYQVVGDMLVAANRVWGVVAITLVCLAVNFALNTLLIPRYGALGAAVTTIACEALRCAGLLSYARFGLKFRLLREGTTPP
ncbi:MAG: flippase [Bacteroidota bacterium]|nr:flippase [Bacteroidota bacterium]